MGKLSLISAVCYFTFSLFVFYQQLHVKNFRGSSQSFALALNVSAFAGMLTGLIYLAYYGWTVTWWPPIVLLLVGLLIPVTLGVLIERIVGSITLSLAGFVGWPISAYFMFRSIPPAA